MKISTRTRYGMRAMVELARAQAHAAGALSVRDIASRQRLSVKYLEKIMAALKAAGLIRSVRGVRGGYELISPPERIAASEVFNVLEGLPVLVDCVKSPEICPMESFCPTRGLWEALGKAIKSVLEETTLEELAERGAALPSSSAATYQI